MTMHRLSQNSCHLNFKVTSWGDPCIRIPPDFNSASFHFSGGTHPGVNLTKVVLSVTDAPDKLARLEGLFNLVK
jgi:hypothetical protein